MPKTQQQETLEAMGSGFNDGSGLRRLMNGIGQIVTWPGRKINDWVNGYEAPLEGGSGVGTPWDGMSQDERARTISPWDSPAEETSERSPTPYVGIRPDPGPGPVDSGGYNRGVYDGPESGPVGIVLRTTRNEPVEEERELQERLLAKGFSVGDDGADGMAGPDTVEALNLYLKSIGIDEQFEVGDVIPESIMVTLL